MSADEGSTAKRGQAQNETLKILACSNVGSVTDNGFDGESTDITVTWLDPTLPGWVELETLPTFELDALKRELQQPEVSALSLRSACVEIGHFLETHRQKLYGEDEAACYREIDNLVRDFRDFGIIRDLVANALKHGAADHKAEKRGRYFDADAARCLVNRVSLLQLNEGGNLTCTPRLKVTIEIRRGQSIETKVLDHEDIRQRALRCVDLLAERLPSFNYFSGSPMGRE